MLEELYRVIQPRIHAFFYAKTWSRETAEDLTQDVFYEALKGSSSFAGHSSVKTWLFGIARNKLHRYYRSKRYQADLAAKLAAERSPGDDTPEERAVKREEQAKLLAGIDRLEELSREIVLLRMYGELSFAEIGQLLGTTENNARVRFYRAKLQLHKEMEGYYGE